MMTGVSSSNTMHLFKPIIDTFVRLVGTPLFYLIEMLMFIVGIKTERDVVEF